MKRAAPPVAQRAERGAHLAAAPAASSHTPAAAATTRTTVAESGSRPERSAIFEST